MRSCSRLLPIAASLLMAGCGASTTTVHQSAGSQDTIPSSLLASMRPIGRGPRFAPPATGHIIGDCRPRLGPRLRAHVEVFGANRVVLLPAGLGTLRPRHLRDGHLTSARCYGAIVTLDRTGVVYIRPGAHVTLGDLFRSWGQALTATRIASFSGRKVSVYVDGGARSGTPSAVPVTEGAEVVVEVGPHVPPHRGFTFVRTPPRTLR